MSVWVEIYGILGDYFNPVCHAPRERVSWIAIVIPPKKLPSRHAPRERVSWNCLCYRPWQWLMCHAPRERVSWNDYSTDYIRQCVVTLHVSVWVEIHKVCKCFRYALVTLHVSVWVEIQFLRIFQGYLMSRSTWACELKYEYRAKAHLRSWSRSTWACELKLSKSTPLPLYFCHAPRERVSWNAFVEERTPHFARSRSTWACELKFITAFCCSIGILSRSTWACELKFLTALVLCKQHNVTLQVSVWVEIESIK